jgi:hypothetical protein
VVLPEKIVGLKIEDAFAKLKEVLFKQGCKVVAEESPTSIAVRQGSLWGITPKTAKKSMRYSLFPHDSGTRITASSSLATSWKNLTVIGSALAVFLAGLCAWIAVDLKAFMATQKASSWSWVATVDGYTDLEKVQMLAGLGRGLALFLSVVIALEVVIALYAHFKINSFAEETLISLS